jgi:RND superfamily putative drug exporter
MPAEAAHSIADSADQLVLLGSLRLYHRMAYYVSFAVSGGLQRLRGWQDLAGSARPPTRRSPSPLQPPPRTIRTSGITLAASFALIAVTPVRSFHEVAFAMAVGLLVETFVVRSLLVPALSRVSGCTSLPG